MSKKKQAIFPPPVLPCTGIETHAHLNDPKYNDDLEEVVARARAAGVAGIVQVFLHPDEFAVQKERFGRIQHMWYILGIHPTEANQWNARVAAQIQELFHTEPRFKAMGEIGLDYYWPDQPRPLQQQVFAEQLELAKRCDVPIVIHSRDAHADTFAMLMEHGFAQRPLLWHCFGENADFALTLVEQGWHLSIPGPVTFPANAPLREAVAAIPLDRLMVETDCPYLSPVPYRGKRNEPAYLGYTIQAMADARNMSAEDLWTACGNNAKRFFGLEE